MCTVQTVRFEMLTWISNSRINIHEWHHSRHNKTSSNPELLDSSHRA